jgi:hypothetical protein
VVRKDRANAVSLHDRVVGAVLVLIAGCTNLLDGPRHHSSQWRGLGLWCLGNSSLEERCRRSFSPLPTRHRRAVPAFHRLMLKNHGCRPHPRGSVRRASGFVLTGYSSLIL